MTDDELAEAIKALIANATNYPALDIDEAQALAQDLPAAYTEVYVTRRYGGNVRGDSRENWLRRLQVRVVARTVSNCRLLETRLTQAFEHTLFDLGNDVLVHFEYEAGGGDFEPHPNTGRYHSLTDYTFAV